MYKFFTVLVFAMIIASSAIAQDRQDDPCAGEGDTIYMISSNAGTEISPDFDVCAGTTLAMVPQIGIPSNASVLVQRFDTTGYITIAELTADAPEMTFDAQAYRVRVFKPSTGGSGYFVLASGVRHSFAPDGSVAW